MGTNYYAEYNRCSCCGRYDEAHIGKSKHIVRVYPDGLPGLSVVHIRSFDDWRTFLDSPDVTVMDEYGGTVADSSSELREWLNTWTNYEDVEDWRERDGYADTYMQYGASLDRDGYHITAGEFS